MDNTQLKKERAVVVLYDQDGRVLLQDRRGISKFGEEWGFFGGGIEAGETPEQALQRELKEELDIEIGAFKLLTVYQVKLEGKVVSPMHWLFAAPLERNTPMHLKEGKAMQWFTTDELKQLTMKLDETDVVDRIVEFLEKK